MKKEMIGLKQRRWRYLPAVALMIGHLHSLGVLGVWWELSLLPAGVYSRNKLIY